MHPSLKYKYWRLVTCKSCSRFLLKNPLLPHVLVCVWTFIHLNWKCFACIFSPFRVWKCRTAWICMRIWQSYARFRWWITTRVHSGFPPAHLTSHHYKTWISCSCAVQWAQHPWQIRAAGATHVMKACCSDLETLSVSNPTAPSAAQMRSVKCHRNKCLQQTCLEGVHY